MSWLYLFFSLPALYSRLSRTIVFFACRVLAALVFMGVDPPPIRYDGKLCLQTE